MLGFYPTASSPLATTFAGQYYVLVSNDVEAASEVTSPDLAAITFGTTPDLDISSIDIPSVVWVTYSPEGYSPVRVALVREVRSRSAMVPNPLSRTSLVPKPLNRRVFTK